MGKKDVSRFLQYKPTYKFVPFKGMVIYDPIDFIRTKLNLLAPRQISMHSGQWFMRRRFFKIYQNFPYIAPYWTPKGASPFI